MSPIHVSNFILTGMDISYPTFEGIIYTINNIKQLVYYIYVCIKVVTF